MKKVAMFRIERYGRTRFWALYEAGELLCLTVYKKGATAVKERLERVEPTPTATTHACGVIAGASIASP